MSDRPTRLKRKHNPGPLVEVADYRGAFRVGRRWITCLEGADLATGQGSDRCTSISPDVRGVNRAERWTFDPTEQNYHLNYQMGLSAPIPLGTYAQWRRTGDDSVRTDPVVGSVSVATLTALAWTFRRAAVLTVLGWQATYATLGAIAADQATLSLLALAVALALAAGVGLFARGRSALVPMCLGCGFTLAATTAFTVAVPLGLLGPVPSADAYRFVPWRAVAAVVYFALFAGLTCFALAAWMLLTGQGGPYSRRYFLETAD